MKQKDSEFQTNLGYQKRKKCPVSKLITDYSKNAKTEDKRIYDLKRNSYFHIKGKDGI